jgi:hypothetical protein
MAHHTTGEIVMHEIQVSISSTEEAFDGTAELWFGGERIGFTCYQDCDLMLWVEPRRDGRPVVVGAHALAAALAQADRLLALY